jgi:hypothetical protein
MTNRRIRALAAASMACLVLCACAKQTTQESTESRQPAALTNPSDFPLYADAKIVEVAPVDYGVMLAKIKQHDPTAKTNVNYRGHEIVASSEATMPQLKAWVAKLKATPPVGFHVTSHAGGITFGGGSRESSAEADALFETAQGRTVFVIALDPRKAREQIGPALDLIDKYSAMPAMLRGPIDDQVKQQLGYTVSEMLDRHSPIGILLATVKTMSSSDRRAIVLVDETVVK